MPWKHILGTVYTVSEDWQEASSWNFYLKLKGDQRLVMRSRRDGDSEKKSKAGEISCAEAWGCRQTQR